MLQQQRLTDKKFFILELPHEKSLLENYGKDTTIPKIAVYSEEGYPMTPYFKCKDFVNDFFWGVANKEDFEIYDYEFDFDPNYTMNQPFFHIVFFDWQLAGELKAIEEDLEKISESHGIGGSFKLEMMRSNVLHFEFTFEWLKSTTYISAAISLIRDFYAPYKQGERILSEHLKDVLNGAELPFIKWEEYDYVEDCHEYSGWYTATFGDDENEYDDYINDEY